MQHTSFGERTGHDANPLYGDASNSIGRAVVSRGWTFESSLVSFNNNPARTGFKMWDLTTIQLNNLNHRIRLQQKKPVSMASTIHGVLKAAAVCRENPIVTLDAISKELDQ